MPGPMGNRRVIVAVLLAYHGAADSRTVAFSRHATVSRPCR